MVIFAFSRFTPEIPFLGEFGRRGYNCQFKLKPGTQTNQNIQNSVMYKAYEQCCYASQQVWKRKNLENAAVFCISSIYTFSVLDLKCPFYGKFGPKSQNYQFKLKFSTQANLNKQNSMIMFTFAVLNQKYPFLANLVQKTTIATLSRNLVLRLIPICKIRWGDVHIFGFDIEHPFFCPKTQNCLFKVKFDTQTHLNMQNSMVQLI